MSSAGMLWSNRLVVACLTAAWGSACFEPVTVNVDAGARDRGTVGVASDAGRTVATDAGNPAPAFVTRALTIASEGAAPRGALLLRGAFANLVSMSARGQAVYLAAEQVNGCAAYESKNLTVSRFTLNAGGPSLSWTASLGNTSFAEGLLAASEDGVTMGGQTEAALPGQVSHGQSDAFVARFRGDGQLAWLHQFGTLERDGISAITELADGTVIVAGGTAGTLEANHVNTLGDELFLAAFDATGNQLWLHQFNLPGYPRRVAQWGDGLAVQFGSSTYGAADPYANVEHALVRLSSSGRLLWASAAGQAGTFADNLFDDGAHLSRRGFLSTGGMQYELYQEQWTTDGGVSASTPSASWPRPGTWQSYLVTANHLDGSWYASTADQGGRTVITTRQDAMGARIETTRWLFEGPEYNIHSNGYASLVTPRALAVTSDAGAVMVGDVVWNEPCDMWGRRWLWISGF
jgi:hypothetical protein